MPTSVLEAFTHAHSWLSTDLHNTSSLYSTFRVRILGITEVRRLQVDIKCGKMQDLIRHVIGLKWLTSAAIDNSQSQKLQSRGCVYHESHGRGFQSRFMWWLQTCLLTKAGCIHLVCRLGNTVGKICTCPGKTDFFPILWGPDAHAGSQVSLYNKQASC